MRRDWEEAHKVVEELVEGPPSRRANATFIASPDGVSVLLLQGSQEFTQQMAVRTTYGQSEANSSVMMAKR